MLELAERERREPVAAALVAREDGLVDDHDVATASSQCDRGRRTGRAGADDEHVARDRGGGSVGCEHGTEATAGR